MQSPRGRKGRNESDGDSMYTAFMTIGECINERKEIKEGLII